MSFPILGIFLHAIGIPLCVLAGVLSALYSLALGAADPVAEQALLRGANPELLTERPILGV